MCVSGATVLTSDGFFVIMARVIVIIASEI